MKNQIGVFIGLIIFVATANITVAQNIRILDSLGNTINSQTITISNSELTTTHSILFNVKNASPSAMAVKLRRYETSVPANTANFFCWSLCYAPVDAGVNPVWTDKGYITIEKDSLSSKKLGMYYTPNGISGLSKFRYVLFDTINPTDSAYLDIVFDIQVGIDDPGIDKEQLHFYPNPVSNYITIDNAGNEKQLFAINNVLGVKVKEYDLSANEKTTVNIGNLPEGIYFMNYYDPNAKLIVKKIVRKN